MKTVTTDSRDVGILRRIYMYFTYANVSLQNLQDCSLKNTSEYADEHVDYIF